MSKTVHVELGERGYDIRIGLGLQPGSSLVAETTGRVLIVSDSHVDALYGDSCEAALRSARFATFRAVVPAGETSKDLAQVRHLYDRALDAGLDRRSAIVALGGGMVGDLAGFVAATFLRGIRLVQVPTSLVAMVDSSVGGKTGVNLPRGKNLVGVFHQPVEVCVDVSMLNSLPAREYVSGLAEVVKYGLIWDATLFAEIERQAERILNRESQILEEIVMRCCRIKADVVAIDEKETAVRAILNFGHTLAHALEAVAGYGNWLHGEAVSVGMVYAAKVSAVERRFPEADYDRLTGLLKRLGLPIHVEDRAGVSVDWPALRQAMVSDKKTVSQVPRFVLADRLGAVVMGCEVADDVLAKSFVSSVGGAYSG